MSLANRTVVWKPASPGFVVALPLAWPERSPADVEDVGLDLVNWLDQGETIAAFDVTSDSNSLELDERRIWGSLCVVTLAGGTPGSRATVELLVTSSAGRTKAFPVSVATSQLNGEIAMPRLSIKQGAVLRFGASYTTDSGDPLDLVRVAASVAAQVRDRLGNLVATLPVALSTEVTGLVKCVDDDTAAWPVGRHLVDLRITIGGHVMKSETFALVVEKAITQ